MEVPRVSVHGGHSGQFCNHAEDSLEEIVIAYIAAGYSWFGVTEHMAAVSEDFVYPDEKESGLNARTLQHRFENYFAKCFELKEKYRDQVELLVGFEVESCSGSVEFVQQTIDKFKPDYIVGSVHHVSDLMIDFSQERYQTAIAYHGGIEALYCKYFDQQFEMIERFEPSVVGHFDLIRIFDVDYKQTIKIPAVRDCIKRNLQAISDRELILDYNMSGFDKLGQEPYPTESILNEAIDLGIAIVPGDDSHGVNMVGRHYERGIDQLIAAGGSLDFRKPRPFLLED